MFIGFAHLIEGLPPHRVDDIEDAAVEVRVAVVAAVVIGVVNAAGRDPAHEEEADEGPGPGPGEGQGLNSAVAIFP